MKSKILLATMAIAITASPAAYAAKSKKVSKHQSHHKAHYVKGWKSCKGAYRYLKGGKCLDARNKPSK